MERKEEKLIEIQQDKTDKICETMAKLSEISASKATEEDVLIILSKCLQALAEAKKNWEHIVRFFQSISSLIQKCSKEVMYETISVFSSP